MPRFCWWCSPKHPLCTLAGRQIGLQQSETSFCEGIIVLSGKRKLSNSSHTLWCEAVDTQHSQVFIQFSNCKTIQMSCNNPTPFKRSLVIQSYSASEFCHKGPGRDIYSSYVLWPVSKKELGVFKTRTFGPTGWFQ